MRNFESIVEKVQCALGKEMGPGIAPRALAIAAIEALAEPTTPMLAAGQWSQFESPNPPVNACVEANMRAEKIWRAMIGAALAERTFA